jgi:predicted phage replisome organizer
MAEGKRYYWLKFRDDFFDSKRIKKLRRMAGGDTYVIIYLKMQLKALKTGGVLEFTGVEQEFADELALDIDESADDVRVVLAFLLSYGLCECSDNVHYYLPYVTENTGSETASTQRVREYRERQKALHCNADETRVKRIGNAEKEIEKEIEIDTPKGVSGRFAPPTLEEVKAYCQERGNSVDPERWYDFYQSKGWMVGRNKMKDWKAAVRTWEKETRTGNAKARKNNTLLNYDEQGQSHASIADIELNLEEL